MSFARDGDSSTADAADYSGLASITIASGQTAGSTTVTITDDQVAEGSESLAITASATGHTGGSLTLTITDDDTAAYTANVASHITHVRLTATVADTGKATVRIGKAGSLADATSGTPKRRST